MLLDETELKRLTSIFTDYAIFTLQSFKNKQKQREKLNQSFYVEICQLLDKNIEHIKRFYNGYKKSNSIDEYMLLATTDLANISGSFGNFIGILLTKSLSQKDLDEIEEIKLSNKPITEYILDVNSMNTALIVLFIKNFIKKFHIYLPPESILAQVSQM